MESEADLYQIVTFARDPLRGNPAFVLGDVRGASDAALAAACAILRADVVAVLGETSAGVTPLRFFTTGGPHAGAGHATLAAAHAVLRGNGGGADGAGASHATVFLLPNGDRRAARVEGDRIAVDFPVMPGSRVDRVAEMTAALGAPPAETFVAPFGYVAVYDDAAPIAAMRPDLGRVAAFDRTAVIATAPGNGASDIVIRVFAPNAGLPEDPVCGTAHRIVVPYWSERMGKARIHSRQLSPRGGDLWCEAKGDLVAIGGETRLVIDGTIHLPTP
jgi:predicted PhzF superfamily epimerase YddE/YHI9